MCGKHNYEMLETGMHRVRWHIYVRSTFTPLAAFFLSLEYGLQIASAVSTLGSARPSNII